jgi:hypothetical protein
MVLLTILGLEGAQVLITSHTPGVIYFSFNFPSCISASVIRGNLDYRVRSCYLVLVVQVNVNLIATLNTETPAPRPLYTAGRLASVPSYMAMHLIV